MSSQQGGAPVSGVSPAEEPVEAAMDASSETAEAARGGSDTAADGTVAQNGAGGSSPERDVRTEEETADAEILAAGGTILGQVHVAGLADRSRVRRAPRYKRFAVLGGLLGVLVAAIATPFASYDSELAMMQGISPWTLFLVLAMVLVPLGGLVSCAVAMFSDRAARIPARAQKKGKGRR